MNNLNTVVMLFFSSPGIRVLYNLYNPEGSRVVDLQVLCTKCRVPEYVPIEDSTSYQFIAPAFIVSGGDGYSMIKEHMTKHHIFGKNVNSGVQTIDTLFICPYLAM